MGKQANLVSFLGLCSKYSGRPVEEMTQCNLCFYKITGSRIGGREGKDRNSKTKRLFSTYSKEW